MQSARHGSVSTVAICSSAPLIRPRATVARIASVRAAGSSKPLSSRAPHTLSIACAVIVGQRRHECLELGVGHREQRTVEQRQRLEAVLHLIHGPRGYRHEELSRASTMRGERRK